MSPRSSESTKLTEWNWPPDLAVYDRTPRLSKEEKRILKDALSLRGQGNTFWLRKYHQSLARLLRPIDELLDYEGPKGMGGRTGVKVNLLCAMHEYGTSYWSWKQSQWMRVLGPSYQAFDGHYSSYECRNYMIAFSYIAGEFKDLHQLGPLSSNTLCRLIFGHKAVDSVIGRCRRELLRIGYGGSLAVKRIPSTVCKAMLTARSPLLEQITRETLVWVRDNYALRTTREDIVPFSRILVSLGLISQPLEPRIGGRKPDQLAATGVHKGWKDWVDRWCRTTTLEPRSYRGMSYCLLKTGRWIARERPKLGSPNSWTYKGASDYVAALLRTNIGDWSVMNRSHKYKLGQPLAPRSIAQSLSSMRAFFRDCQEWGWINRRFDPGRAFRTPKSIKAKIQTNPRTISDEIWAKLLWAGLNLTEEDLPKLPRKTDSAKVAIFYPCEMVRAVAGQWPSVGCSAAYGMTRSSA